MEHSYENFQETSNVKPVAHFSNHAFLIRFDNINSYYKASLFELIYERLVIPLTHRKLFEYKAIKYRKYWQYDASIFKKDFLRSRYNIDELVIQNSEGAHNFFAYLDNQFPISIQKHDEKFKANNISDLSLKYHINSGYYHTCHYDSLYERLQALTHRFNAYDRIFCDTFERHGLHRSFQPYWDNSDIYLYRDRLLRDEFLSSFPPDASNAVYYASPKLTFMVLQKNPVTWQFIVRPFSKSLWVILVVYYVLFKVFRYLDIILEWINEQTWKLGRRRHDVFKMILYGYQEELNNVKERHGHTVETFHSFLRVIVTSAYGGMILFGILNPIYPWTPGTFAELNQTRNYYVCVAMSSAYGMIEQLKDSNILNGIDNSMILSRTEDLPADYLAKELKKEGKDKDKSYAAIMYDDKMNFWLKGRHHISKTAPFLKRLKPARAKTLPEMRYVSVSAGATRLHFLIDTLRWVFTAGSWMRWYHLEQNYYKNVVPIIVNRILVKDLNLERMREDNESRSLSIYDMYSLFAFIVCGCVLAFTLYIAENLYADRYMKWMI
ncbi:unnamed protein product [Orchesella dallaii]|uniref:Uncharacterized protein n=1 Tax=Orchesella dallaii TaxID=48710 RepID=A0ABP1PK59_9HEXA